MMINSLSRTLYAMARIRISDGAVLDLEDSLFTDLPQAMEVIDASQEEMLESTGGRERWMPVKLQGVWVSV